MAVKNVAGKRWSLLPSADRRRYSAWPGGDNPAAVLPSWVPALGAAITHTTGGGVMTNNWRDVFDPTGVGYSAASCADITDYSAMIVAPSYRTHGAHLMGGGGHSASNYNGWVARVYAESTIYHEAVIRPSAWAADLSVGNIAAEVNALGECTAELPTIRLTNQHVYGSGDVIDGKLTQVYSQACGYANFASFAAAHELDLNPAVSAATKSWSRLRATVGTISPGGAPTLTRYVPAQNRIFLLPRGGGAPYGLQWYDRASNTYVTGSGTGFNYSDGDAPGFDPRTGAFLHVPERDLLIAAYRLSGNLTIQYMNVASGVSQPTLGGTATLSASLAVPDIWGAIGWCPRNNRLHVFGVTGNTDKVYEIEIPGTLSSTWTVTPYTLPGGATIVPYETGGGCAWGKTFDWIPGIDCFAHHPSGISGAGNDSGQFYRPRSL